jgi:CheY-like chemotaxis protein
VVDDNASMRALISSVMEDIHPVVHECADAETALDLYPVLHPDWVLMDVRMAGIDGIAATRLLRLSHPDARVIIVTSYDDEQSREAARAAGAHGFVLKRDLTVLPGLIAGSGSSA